MRYNRIFESNRGIMVKNNQETNDVTNDIDADTTDVAGNNAKIDQESTINNDRADNAQSANILLEDENRRPKDDASSTPKGSMTTQSSVTRRHHLQQKLTGLSIRASKFYKKSKTYQAVDLKGDFETDSFRRQSRRLTKELFGAKGASAYQLISKVTPDDKLSMIGDLVYGKVANVARAWAAFDLKKDTRFVKLASLNADEKRVWADEIGAQSHLWASLSGITGFFGLKGVVADTAWLLLVSLKSIYQLAMIYDYPLSGKEGVRLAYGVLSKCDLDNMQEKQAMMTALALGDTVLKNAQHTSLLDEIRHLAQKYNHKDYAEQLNGIFGNINLDKYNPKWLHYLLPITSLAVVVHYNNELIEEVLGVARATFANEHLMVE